MFLKFDLPSACFLNFSQYSATFLIMEYCLCFPNLFSKSVHKIVKVYKFRIFCDLKNWISQFCPWDNRSTITWFKRSTYESQHSWFLEHWNSQKSLCNIRHRFSYQLDEWIEKICKKFFFHGGFFFKSTLSVLRCTWTGRINLKMFLGHHIN